MGAILSTAIGTIALVAVGVLSSIAASKLPNDDPSGAEKINTYMAIGAFVLALIMLVLAIVAL